MGCILGTLGPYVYPQSTPTHGKIVALVHLLRIAERGTGGEDGVYAQAPRLVGPRRARPAVAQDARSVPRARLRVHAAADAGEPRGGVLSAVSRAVSRSRDASAGPAPGGPRSLGWARLLRQGFESPRARARGQSRPRWHAARRTRGADQVAGSGAIHCRGRGDLRVREAGARRRYERVEGAAASLLAEQPRTTRSEEHTSELQSHSDLVCRLL